ncbi:STAS domain-containing protein [Exilibacterium tricleocarpae]|uniref:STAS domain-containing protein n=1 Tax=Exilibacterium tricleocarpae TaxID=2591008 RepID=A0A545TNE4_9GAMM|nr:STAS domain-containing protein [Exilibacterium tricleocarpae]TQV78708.1 STAS domain-containing protein [Exilibacterium tricleocarpae]
MQPGQILVAEHDGVYVIKMVGDVRLTLCISFDQFIDSMLEDSDFCSILFDLTGAEAIDSTTLGLMAKISILGNQRRGIVPVVVSTNPSINRLLESMGFEDIFEIIHEPAAAVTDATCLPVAEVSEQVVKGKVLEAHRILMGLNETNRETFRDLVKSLERPGC